MRTLLLSLSTLLLLAACEGDRCADVTCDAEGTMCSPVDGLCHCGSVDGDACAVGDSCHAPTSTCFSVPPAVCGAGAAWSPGERAFEEATTDWSLTDVVGVRIGAVDYDGDGWTDLTVRNLPAGFDDFAAGGARHTWLLRNTGDGRFEDVTQASGLLTPRAGGALGRPVEVLAWGDVDGDGDLDAYLGTNTVDLDGVNMGETSEVMFQDAPGHFVVGPDSNGVRFADDIDVPAGAAFVDVDLDSDLDLWVGQHNYTTPSGGLSFRQDRLWRNDGSGNFSDVTIESGLQTQDWNSLAALNEGRGLR